MTHRSDVEEAYFVIARMKQTAVDGKLYVTPSQMRYLIELVAILDREFPMYNSAREQLIAPMPQIGSIEVIVRP